MAEDPNTKDSEATEWLIVGVHKEDHAMNNLLLSYADAVHVHGEPSAWYLEKIIADAPRLKKVRVIPAFAHMVELGHEAGKLLAKHGIEVVIGCIKERRKDRTDFVTSSYRDKRYFMLRLDEERKKVLPELQRYAPEDWEIASRYLCLNGEKHLTLLGLARERGVSMGHIQEALGTVLYHLDSPFDAPLASVRRAQVLQEKIERAREEDRLFAIRLEKLKSLDLTLADLPQGMSDDYLEDYVLVRKGWLRGELGEYLLTPREREFLIRRYGLRNHQFCTLEEIGNEFGITRERVRQIEQKALKKLRQFKVCISPSS